ncbi:MAG: response regulator [Sphingobacteriaceae bacterium]|nr:response regulator [Sphingobacteriaceae bacterium]
MQEEINVLYVDDEENNLIAFKASFRRDFNIFTALSAKEAETILDNNLIHVLITDQRMPEALGTELLAKYAMKFPDQVRILLTGFADIEALKDAVNTGRIFRYVEKPWNEGELKKTIQDSFQVYQIKKAQDDFNKKVLLTNEQLEFMLRQKLLD